MDIAVVGLGKLGLCTAACFASMGHRVIGVEKDLHFTEQLRARRCPIKETGLEELLSKSWDNLIITADVRQAVQCSEITLIVVPTPSKPDGKFTNKYVKTVLKTVGAALKQNSKFSVIDVVSTVMPGSSDRTFMPLLEELSSKVCGRDFGLVYNPEFIALGSVIRDFMNPDMVLIGASDKRSADLVKQLYVSTCQNQPYIATMSLLNAEITKLSLNCFVTMKISFANAVSRICQSCAGADVDVVTHALGCDKRISPLYLRGGLSYGGACFPRDTAAFIALSKQCGCEAELVKAVQKTNEQHNRYLSELVLSHVDPVRNSIEPEPVSRKGNISNGVDPGVSGTVSVLGLAFKPGTPVIVESPAIKLIDSLLQRGIEVTVYDPLAMENTRGVFGDRISYAASVEDCISKSSVCVITTQEDEFKQIDETYIVNERMVIIDCWRILDPAVLGPNVDYIPMGRWKKAKNYARDYASIFVR
jgi:UDPglucose 6-dehydrogenase